MLGGGNSKIFGCFIPKLGEDEPMLTSIFFKGVRLKPLTSQVKLVNKHPNKMALFQWGMTDGNWRL